MCDKAKAGGDYDARGARDIYAAMDILRAIPEINMAARGLCTELLLGASAAPWAIDARNAAYAQGEARRRDCLLSLLADRTRRPRFRSSSSSGTRRTWTSAVRCRALERTPNVKVVVYAGVGHGFLMPFGHQVEYNHNAAGDAKGRAEAFLDAHTIR